MDETLSLEGWKMYSLGVKDVKKGNSTIIDYGTTEIPITVKTLGELRKTLVEKNS